MVHVVDKNYDSFTKDLDLLDYRLFLWWDDNDDYYYVSWDKWGHKDEDAARSGIVRKVQTADGERKFPDRREIDILDRFNMSKKSTAQLVQELDAPEQERKIQQQKQLQEKIEESVEKIRFHT